MLAGVLLSGGCSGGLCSLPFPASRGCPHFLAAGPNPGMASLSPCFCHCITLPDSGPPVPSFPFIRTLVLHGAHPGNPRCSLYLKILNVMTSAKPRLPCKVTYSQTPGIGMWASLGGNQSAYRGGHSLACFCIFHACHTIGMPIFEE